MCAVHILTPLLHPDTHPHVLPQAGTNPEEMMRQMSIPDLAQKLDQTESTFGQVHPQVCPQASQSRIYCVVYFFCSSCSELHTEETGYYACVTHGAKVLITMNLGTICEVVVPEASAAELRKLALYG